HGQAAADALEARGALVRTGARAVELEDGAVVLGDGERVLADVVVVALPPADSAALLGDAPPKLEDSPIVSVHLVFDRTLLHHELAALLASPAHWVFDRGRLTGHEPERGQYLTVVSSGAPELLDLRGKALVDAIAAAVTERLGAAELLWSRVSREPAATFAPRPAAALGVSARGRLPGQGPERGQSRPVVSGGAPGLLARRGRALVDAIAAAVTERLGAAELLWSRVSREPAATFAPRPAAEAERLP